MKIKVIDKGDPFLNEIITEEGEKIEGIYKVKWTGEIAKIYWKPTIEIKEEIESE